MSQHRAYISKLGWPMKKKDGLPCDSRGDDRRAKPKPRMSKITQTIGSIVLAAGLLHVSADASARERSANELLDAVDDLYRGDSSQGKMSMVIVTENWTRSLVAEMASRGKDNTFIRILSPKKERGTTTLRVGRDIWNYLPKVDRVIKLPSSMMSVSWMGSHVTNNDLVRESRFAEDFECEITFDGERDGAALVEIDCFPLPDAAVEWGKVGLTLDGIKELPIEVRYYDEDLALARTISYHDLRLVDDREMPTTMIVVPTDEPDESTTVSYDEITFDVELSEDFFSIRRLREN